jgi:uncharacterized protein YbcC (UPF0753/DUF2309 family)
MKYVEPEVFLIHDGVTVYHVYKGNNITDKSMYFYSTDRDETEAKYQFDVRQVYYQLHRDTAADMPGDLILGTIREAIELKKLKIPLWQKLNKFEKLLNKASGRGRVEVVESLIGQTCDKIMTDVKSLPLREQITFFLGQWSEDFLEQVIRDKGFGAGCPRGFGAKEDEK